MRNTILGLASAVLAMLAVEGRSAAQPPDGFRRGGGLERVLDDMKLSETKRSTAGAAVRAYDENGRTLTDLAGADLMLKMKDILSPEEYKKIKEKVKESTDRGRGPGGDRGRGGDLGANAIVERIMSFDKNGDGKITKEELPERMQNLIEKGDTNKDGVLDKEEIKKLAADMARDGSGRDGFGGRGPGGPGGRAAAPAGFPPSLIERIVNDLKLSDTTKEKAAAAVKASQESIRKLTDLARADLLVKMDRVLTEDEMKTFKTALERQPIFGDRRPGGRDGRPPFPRP